MTKMSDIGPLERPRRGISFGALLFWMITAAAAGAVAWDLYGSEVRSRLGVVSNAASPPPPESTPGPTSDEIVVLLNNLQTAQRGTADQLEAVRQILESEQAASKTMAESLAVLGAKVDALQHTTVGAAKKPTPIPPHRPAAAVRPPSPGPEQPEPAPGEPAAQRP